MRSAILWVMALVYLGVPSAWGADQNKVLDKRLTIYGGVRFYQADGTFSSTRGRLPPVQVDMDDLSLDKNESNGIGGIIFNFGQSKRWNLRFDYYGYHDEATTTAGKDFNFGGVVIPVNATVNSRLDIDLYVLSVAYNIVHTEKSRLGIGAGVHGIDLDIGISGSLSVGESEVYLGEGQEDFIIPVPNLWIYGAYAFTDNIILRYGGGWLSAEYDDYDGSLLLATAAVEYWPFQNFGFGLGYNYITADIDHDSGNTKENYDVDLSGVALYITLGF